MIVALFEDDDYANFLPLTYTRPVFMLRSGMFTAIERLEVAFPDARLFLFCRNYLKPTVKQKTACFVNEPDKIDDDLLLVNASLVLDEPALSLINHKLGQNVMIIQNQRLLAARLSEQVSGKLGEVEMPLTTAKAKKILRHSRVLRAERLATFSYPWELVDRCPKLIESDYRIIGEAKKSSEVDGLVAICGATSDVHLAEGSTIEAFVTLDARSGPIYIGRNSVVQSGSRIAGPAYIGDETTVASALIHSGCSIGNGCRVGGELEQTILHDYTNKHHFGYFGHSCVGEWINIGAGTTNSNLKNTYGTVRVNINGKSMETRRIKVGCFIGDHSKTAIGTQIYTGKKIGAASQVHGLVTNDVPSFTIWAKTIAEPVEFHLESAIQTQKRMFERRNIKQTKADVELMRRLFTMTANERRKAGVAKKRFQIS